MSQTKTDKPKGAIVQDAEIQALNSCNKALVKLTGEEQRRIVYYLQSKYLGVLVSKEASSADRQP